MIESILRISDRLPIGTHACRRWSDQVLHRCGQLLSRLAKSHSVAGDSLPERMRSTTFALLGITAAVGLGFVALIAQQGWPVLPIGPIPGVSVGHEAVGHATALASTRLPAGRAARRGASFAAPSPHRGAGRPRPARLDVSNPGVSGSHRVVRPAASQPAPEPLPASPGGPAPAQPPAPAPAPSPAAPPATPPPTSQPVALAPTPSASPAASTSGHGHHGGHHESGDEDHGFGAAPPAPTESTAEKPEEEEPASPEGSEPEDRGPGHGHAFGHDR
jgi:hypothetical protein